MSRECTGTSAGTSKNAALLGPLAGSSISRDSRNPVLHRHSASSSSDSSNGSMDGSGGGAAAGSSAVTAAAGGGGSSTAGSPASPAATAAAAAVVEPKLFVLGNGSGSPCLDLSRVPAALADATVGVDLLVIEGMGRAIHTNLYTPFKCDTLKLAMIKTERLAVKLFGGCLYDCMCSFQRAPAFPAAGSGGSGGGSVPGGRDAQQ